MLQRRFASSVYAVRPRVKRMRNKRRKILDDLESYRQQQSDRKLPKEFDDLPYDEQAKSMQNAEEAVLIVDPIALREAARRLM